MYYLYLIALVPVAIGGLLFYKNKNIDWREWLLGSLVSFLLAGIFHFVSIQAINSKMEDTETHNGRVVEVVHHAAWKEYYEEAIYRTEYYYTTEYYTDSKGRSKSRQVQKSRRVFDHWEPRRRWHSDEYIVSANINFSTGVDEHKYKDLYNKFGKEDSYPGTRVTMEHNSRMIDGDPNDYKLDNINGWIEPVQKKHSFDNRIKAAPTILNFSKVPTNIFTFDYPYADDWNVSSRLMGNASEYFDILKFDQLNAILGPSKRVNLILIGVTNNGEFAEYQKAAWLGGKRNDLIVIFNPIDRWVRCFGWTESELCKKNIETLFLEKPINDSLLPLIKEEIVANYKVVNWHKFDYIKIQPPNSVTFWYLGCMIVIQLGLYVFFHKYDLVNQRWHGWISNNYKYRY